MIQTKYNIDFAIDDKIYPIVVREPNAKEKKELEIKANESKALISQLEDIAKKERELGAELKACESEIEINKAIIKEGNVKDKLSLLWENKKLNKRKNEITKELLALGTQTEILGSIDENLEESFKFKSKLLIIGDDFLALVHELGISHKRLWEILSEKIAEAQAKK